MGTRVRDDETGRGDKVSLCKVYVSVFVLFSLQIICIYIGYVCYVKLDSKYEERYLNLQKKFQTRNDRGIRIKRDVAIQDNSILRSSTDDIKIIDDEIESAKNESSVSMDEIVHLKQNFSDEAWIWLNKYSRVPLRLMGEFCKVTREQCPTQKGEPGSKGDIGEKGEKGDIGRDGADGRTGIQGSIGPQGPPGLKGDRGEKGDRGWPGLDGRFGIPGEPGLNGIPGRNGKDGINGKNGARGIDGIPGMPGRNGTNGFKGDRGERGVPGPIGPTGLPGKQGKPGNPGADGIPGTPGITARNCSVNGTQKLLVPPSIVGAEPNYYQRDIVAKEFTPIKMKCTSTGEPKPVNVWRKIENNHQVPIRQGAWEGVNLEDNILYFMNISRIHMGDYVCLANNGIPPSANLTTFLYVHFPPYIEIDNVILNVTVGGYARLRCKFEAFPHGVYYWEDNRGIIYEETFDRFHVEYYHIGLYETILELNITNIRKDELGIYYCIGKNDEGLTKGYINVTDDSGSELQVTEICHKNRVKFGNPAPPADGKICADCPKCKVCGFGYRDLEIRTIIGNQTSRLSDKVSNCEMETIGKPVYHNSLPGMYGGWMRESYLDRVDSYWITTDNCTKCLYEYANKNMFTNKTITKQYELKEPFMGNDHVVYNGSFYYSTKRDKTIYIIRYDLEKEAPTGEALALSYCDTGTDNYLYKSEHNHVDIMSDDNGLWAVCAITKSNNTAVTKINTTRANISIEKAWDISVKHQDAGDMFIICGILYAVDSVKQYETRISLALDLYTEKLLEDVKITFTNPFVNTSMIAYNYRYKELYTWDAGNMLTYPIKCRALGNETNTNDTFNEIRATNTTNEVKNKIKTIN